LTGPTGGGKTEVSLQLPSSSFEIVSFDSRQVYRELELGTTKPTLSERKSIPHHLVDFLEPSQKMNAREYAELAESAVLDIWQRGKIPVLTAGTGFYLKAFLSGMFVVPDIQPEVSEKVSSLSLDAKLELLRSLDPGALDQIHSRDEYRITRALEVCLSGELWTQAQKKQEAGFLQKYQPQVQGYFIVWPREVLYQRINERAKLLLEGGMIEETKTVVSKYGKDCPALGSLGYPQVIEYLEGQIDFDVLVSSLSQAHRNYAKKQITWFKKETLLEPLEFQKILDKILLHK
jgi:tRNA dimethylallyltransferase